MIEQLGDDHVAEMLAYARRLLGGTYPPSARPQTDGPARPHALPTLHRASALGSIDDLRAALFAPEESVEEFDAAIRRWREEREGV